MPLACIDETNGALDIDGEGCKAYDNEPTYCGDYDDEDFTANSMCCACGNFWNDKMHLYINTHTHI